jgi:hypothetical protein
MNFDAARIVNQIQHVCKNPGTAGRWPFSTTFAAPDRVAADWFGQAPPQRLPEFRNGLLPNTFRRP